MPESFPFALASPQSTHALAIQLDNQAENLAACLNLAVSSAETGSTMGDDTAAWRAASLIREVRQHIWFLRMTFIALHGADIAGLADGADDVDREQHATQQAAVLRKECPMCQLWEADISERLNIAELRWKQTE